MITLSDGITTLTLLGLLRTNHSRASAAGSERPTLGGRLIIQRLNVAAGQEIILEARLSGNSLQGRFLWSQVIQLKAWRDAGTILTLTYDSQTTACMIPLAGIEIEPIRQFAKIPAADALCAGTLIIQEV